MICDNCNKKDVCRYKEKAILIQEKIKELTIEIDRFIFSCVINCRYHYSDTLMKQDVLYRDSEEVPYKKI